MADVNNAFKEICAQQGKKYGELYNSQQFDKIPELYTKNCLFLGQGAPSIKYGEIAEFWKTTHSLGFSNLRIITAEVIGPMGDHAIEMGRFEFRDKDGKELQIGKYVIIWSKEEDGQWKYLWDMSNADSE